MKNEIEKTIFMIKCVYDECNIINRVINVRMINMNYIIKG